MTMTLEQPAEKTNGNGGEKAIVQRTFQPLAPVGNAGALKGLLEAQRGSIALALPKHITPERLIKTMLVAANRTPDLLQCTQASILETINRAAELGLDLSGTLGEAYPVPFNNNVGTRDNPNWVKQCQLIIGYRGFAKLARQTGEIKRIEADIVRDKDVFCFRKGSDARCEFTPNLRGDRGEVVGAYAFVQFKDGGEQFDFMPVQDIEKVRARSKSGNDRNGNAIGAWKSDWDEMAKKTIFRRVAKWLPLSTEKFVAALEQDEADYDLAQVLEAQTGHPRARGIKALEGKITNRPVSEGQTLEPTPEALEAARLSEDEALRILAEKSPSVQQQAPQQEAADTLPSDNQSTEDGTEGQQGPAPATPAECATPESFMDCINAAGVEHFESPEKLNRWLEGKLMRIQKKGKLDKTTVNWRMDTLNLLRAGKLD